MRGCDQALSEERRLADHWRAEHDTRARELAHLRAQMTCGRCGDNSATSDAPAAGAPSAEAPAAFAPPAGAAAGVGLGGGMVIDLDALEASGGASVPHALTSSALGTPAPKIAEPATAAELLASLSALEGPKNSPNDPKTSPNDPTPERGPPTGVERSAERPGSSGLATRMRGVGERVGRDVRAGMRVLGEGVAEGVREDAQSVVEGLGSMVRSVKKLGQRTPGRPSDADADQVI